MPISELTDEEIGDVLATSGENPVLEVPAAPALDAPTVVGNFSFAREPHGDFCIRVVLPRPDITAAEAHQLAVVLTDAADHIGEIRVKQGYDS